MSGKYESSVTDSICAVVITYFPDQEFNARLLQLVPQVAKVIVIDNTPGESASTYLRVSLRDMPRVLLLENRINRGIAAALNQGLELASMDGYRWMLTLDQDTLCQPDMVDTLLNVSRTCKPTPIVIGGNYLDPQKNRTKVRTGDVKAFLDQKTVITSGSLVDVRLAIQIGGFREDYFIDQVDHEFCLRARAHGQKIVISCKPIMTHSVGQTGGVKLPFLGISPSHPPVRKYYIARNTVVTIKTYWRHEPAWCLRRLIRLVLGLGHLAVLEEDRATKVRAFAAGVIDGVSHRMGPCRRQWLTRT